MKNTEQIAKNVKISLSPAMVHVAAFGMTLAEIRYDACGLAAALRIAADVIDANADMIAKNAQRYAEGR